MRKYVVIYTVLLCLLFVSCVPEQEIAIGVNNTLSALQTLTNIPTYINFATYTKYPTYTIERAATYTSTISKTPTKTESATFTKINTQSPNGIGAMTATGINYHIPGQYFIDDNCRISFEYPLDWMIEYANSGDPDKYSCFYGLRPNNYGLIVENADYCMSDYALYIGVMNLNLTDSAKWGMFFYENGYWITDGYQGGSQLAEIISTRGLIILRGKVWQAMWDKKCEGIIGISEHDSAVINGGGNKSIVISDDSTTFQLHFEYILQTIKIF